MRPRPARASRSACGPATASPPKVHSLPVSTSKNFPSRTSKVRSWPFAAGVYATAVWALEDQNTTTGCEPCTSVVHHHDIAPAFENRERKRHPEAVVPRDAEDSLLRGPAGVELDVRKEGLGVVDILVVVVGIVLVVPRPGPEYPRQPESRDEAPSRPSTGSPSPEAARAAARPADHIAHSAASAGRVIPGPHRRGG